MNNNTLGTCIWLGVMAVLVFILRMGDGGLDSVMGQIDGWFLAATSLSESGASSVSMPSIGVGSLWPLIIVGGLLSAVVAVLRSSAGDDDKLAARKHLALQYKLQAKDLDL